VPRPTVPRSTDGRHTAVPGSSAAAATRTTARTATCDAIDCGWSTTVAVTPSSNQGMHP